MLRLERLQAATVSWLLTLPETGLKPLREIAKDSTASASMINGGFALNGPRILQGPLTWKLWTITRRVVMARIIIHPGEHLADELEALGMSANQLAKGKPGVPANRITQIILGKRGITGDTALRLGWWFGTGPDIWINLQKNYGTAAGSRGESLSAEKNPPAWDQGKSAERAACVKSTNPNWTLPIRYKQPPKKSLNRGIWGYHTEKNGDSLRIGKNAAATLRAAPIIDRR